MDNNKINIPFPLAVVVIVFILFLFIGIPSLFFGALIWIKNMICSVFLFFWNFGIEKYQKDEYLLAFIGFFFLIFVFWFILNLLKNYLFRTGNGNQGGGGVFSSIVSGISSLFGKIGTVKLNGRIIFWTLLILAAFTFKYWSGPLGDSLGNGLRNGGTNFWTGLTGDVNPESLPVSTLSYDIKSGRQLIIPPRTKTLITVPPGGSRWGNMTSVMLSPLGSNKATEKKSLKEEHAEKKYSTVPAVTYYVYNKNTSSNDTLYFTVTW